MMMVMLMLRELAVIYSIRLLSFSICYLLGLWEHNLYHSQLLIKENVIMEDKDNDAQNQKDEVSVCYL